MSAVWSDLASEFLHLYPRGRRLIAVSGADAERSRRAADDLAAALTSAEQHVERRHVDDEDESTLRSDIIAPFRDADGAAVLVVSGPAMLVAPTARGLWNFIVWQLAGDEPPHSIANALIDLTDPENASRRFADYCALPSSFGA